MFTYATILTGSFCSVTETLNASLKSQALTGKTEISLSLPWGPVSSWYTFLLHLTGIQPHPALGLRDAYPFISCRPHYPLFSLPFT